LQPTFSEVFVALVGPFEDPIPLPDGRKLLTPKDAADYITKLPKKESDLPEWQTAIEVLLLCSRGGPTMMARKAWHSNIRFSIQAAAQLLDELAKVCRVLFDDLPGFLQPRPPRWRLVLIRWNFLWRVHDQTMDGERKGVFDVNQRPASVYRLTRL
jgi:hypothetical protein